MARSAIEWTESTWNPVTGCDKIGPGCKHCYAERMARRLQGMGQPNYRHGFRLTLQPAMLERPLAWRKPQMVFVNSMSDLVHKDVPPDFIQRVFAVMAGASWHTFQVPTKRADRLEAVAAELPWPPNVWMGVSVEREDYAFRIDYLRRTPAAVKFVSLEPLLGPLGGLDLSDIDWVIVGGESGPRARPMEDRWALDIRDQCRRAAVPFFFNQWGGRNKKAAGRLLSGRTWDELPRSVPPSASPLSLEPDGPREAVVDGLDPCRRGARLPSRHGPRNRRGDRAPLPCRDRGPQARGAGTRRRAGVSSRRDARRVRRHEE